MHKTDLEKKIESFKTELRSPFERYPKWLIEDIKKYINKRDILKESLLFVESKFGISINDLRIILEESGLDKLRQKLELELKEEKKDNA